MAFCPMCGANNWDTVKFCTSCGSPLTQSRTDKTSESATQGSETAFCPQCGESNKKESPFCRNCGASLQRVQQTGRRTYPVSEKVDNHMVKAILTTIFCCLPFGIVAIVYAAQVDGKVRSGDIAGAIEASNNADKWGNWSIYLGVAVIALNIVLQIILVASGASSGN